MHISIHIPHLKATSSGAEGCRHEATRTWKWVFPVLFLCFQLCATFRAWLSWFSILQFSSCLWHPLTLALSSLQTWYASPCIRWICWLVSGGSCAFLSLSKDASSSSKAACSENGELWWLDVTCKCTESIRGLFVLVQVNICQHSRKMTSGNKSPLTRHEMHLWCCAYLNAKQQPSKKTSRSQGSVMICISSELQCFWASPSVHPVAIPLLHQHSACSLENTIAIVGNGRFGPPFPSNTASIWTGSKNLQECWGVASLYVLSRQDVLAMGQGGKLSKEAIGAEFAQSAQSAPAMSNVIEKKGVAVGGAEDSHRKAEGSQHRISAILCMLGRVCFDFAWGRACIAA